MAYQGSGPAKSRGAVVGNPAAKRVEAERAETRQSATGRRGAGGAGGAGALLGVEREPHHA